MIFALSRTGFPLDNPLHPFVPDVWKKISYRVLDAFTRAAEASPNFRLGGFLTSFYTGH